MVQKSSTKSCTNGYPNTITVVFYQALEMLPNVSKDVIPCAHYEKCYLQVLCSCDNTYVGGTTQLLGSMISQNVPKYTREFDCSGLSTRLCNNVTHFLKNL